MSGSRTVCTFFASTEGCPYGATCNFSHDVSSSAADHSQTQLSATAPAFYPRDLGSRQDRPRANRRPCRYFQAGHCSRGNDCTFLHEYEGYEPKPAVKHVKKRESARGNSNANTNAQPCRFYNSPAGCRMGHSCNFSHDVESRKRETSRQQPVCKHFMSSSCKFRNNCRFMHPVDKDRNPDPKLAAELGYVAPGKGPEAGEVTVDEVKAVESAVASEASGDSLKEPSRADLSEESLQKQRDTEIRMLKKRYPQVQECEIPGKEYPSYHIKFTPTDPDWPFDVKVLPLSVEFPPSYPNEMMNVSIPEDSNLPETVRRCVLFTIDDWVTARFKNFMKKRHTELMFRPFLRWLDRELMDIFTDALTHYRKELVAKEAGIDIIPARHLKAKYSARESESESSEQTTDEPLRPGETSLTIHEARLQEDEEGFESEDDDDENEQNKENRPKFDAVNPVKKGTEVKIKDLAMKEFVGTLMATSIKLLVKCERCKHQAEVTTPGGRVNLINCAKCHQTQLVQYRPAIMHPFSFVLGYLDLEQCLAFDMVLVDCQFVGNCLNCNKDNEIGGISPGQIKNSWCGNCHSKMSVAMECAQFRQLQPSDLDALGSVHKLATEKIIRAVKDPAIKEGQPLPDQGTCKHYKKSYRWLRFPCCGKAYPCDTCHDDHEMGDHEMKYANRMICGFCAKEQTFAADRPCTGCGNSMTRRPTHHWEGGKGCRDVIRMSRTDDKKYANLNKTISRAAQAKTQSGKKTTKLRHT